MKKISLALLILSTQITVNAAPFRSLTQKEVDKVVASIPVKDPDSRYSNIGDRLASYGLRVVDGTTYGYDKKSELEGPTDRVGDVNYSLHTTETTDVFKREHCDFSGSLMFLKRGGKYYPENRGAMWIMTGECRLPPRH